MIEGWGVEARHVHGERGAKSSDGGADFEFEICSFHGRGYV